MELEPTAEAGLPTGSMSVTEVTGLVQLFNNQLLAMEGRLSAKMDDNSRLASERWVKHDHDAERVLADIEKRFQKMQTDLQAEIRTLASDLKEHVEIANAHWKKEADSELVVQARVKPVVTLAQYIARNWKTIALIIALITTGLLAWVETVEHMVTGG